MKLHWSTAKFERWLQ